MSALQTSKRGVLAKCDFHTYIFNTASVGNEENFEGVSRVERQTDTIRTARIVRFKVKSEIDEKRLI
jgi:hypothetical protein